MQYGEILDSVKARPAIGDDEAETALVATLQALTERLTASEAHDLLSQLPDPVRRKVPVPRQVTVMGADEFVVRVSEIGAVDAERARAYAQAVFAALREAVTYGEFSDVLDQLGPEYVELLG